MEPNEGQPPETATQSEDRASVVSHASMAVASAADVTATPCDFRRPAALSQAEQPPGRTLASKFAEHLVGSPFDLSADGLQRKAGPV